MWKSEWKVRNKKKRISNLNAVDAQRSMKKKGIKEKANSETH